MRTPHVTQIEKDPFRPWARVVRRNDGARGRGAADEFKRTERALRPLLTLHAFRFVGLAFRVKPDASAYDIGSMQLLTVARSLALAVLATSWGLAVVWLFNLWGAVDCSMGSLTASSESVCPPGPWVQGSFLSQ